MPTSPFEITQPDGVILRGDSMTGRNRHVIFMTGFLSKRWGNKSKSLVQWCEEQEWGFTCFDYRGSGGSDGKFTDYTLTNWIEDAQAVVDKMKSNTPLSIVGNSLGSWVAWIIAQRNPEIADLLLIAPAFNMMGERAKQIAPERREQWQKTGWMPYDDDDLHRDFPLSWQWVEESEALWQSHESRPRRVPTTILHGLQDIVIPPSVSWKFAQQVLTQDPEFPIELIYKSGDHRLSSPEALETFRGIILSRTI